MDGRLTKQVISYIIVGGIATLIDYGGYYLLVTYTPVHYLLANTIAFIVSVLFNYWGSMSFVFDSKITNKFKEFTLFLGSNVITWVMASVILYIGVTLLNQGEMLIKIIAGVITLITNFILRKLIFEKPKNTGGE